MSTKQEKEDSIKQLDERTTAKGLLEYAHEYFAGYEIIQEAHPASHFAVKYYLLCHCLELTMKAWLRQRGATYIDLKNLGHDLEKIMIVLHDDHSLLVDTGSQEMIRLVNQHYSQKEFEYALDGTKYVPVITQLAGTVRLLISKARFDILLDGDPRKLRASRSIRAKP